MASPEPAQPLESASSSRRLRRSALEHYDTAPIRKIPIERWVNALGALDPELLPRTLVTIDDVVAVLTTGEPGPPIQELLHVLHDFGTPVGAQAVHEAAIELGLNRKDWPQSVEELAIEVWSRALNDRAYEHVLRLAEIAIHDRQTELRCREFTAQAAGPLRCDGAAVIRLEEELRPWFTKEGMGEAVSVRVHAEPDRHVLCVSHGARVQNEATVGDDGRQGLLTFRPLICDVLSYEHVSGRLRITARSRRLVDAYRQAMGKTFHGHSDFFEERPIYTLSPFLAAIRTGSLPAAPLELGIRTATVVECVWTVGDGVVHRIYGPRGLDCTEQARRAQFHPDHDELTLVKVAFVFDGARRPERVDVVVREDNRLDCRKPLHRDAIDTYLEHIGARRTRAQPLRSRPLSQLAGVQAAARWKQALGDEMRAAVENGVLVLASRPAVGDGTLPIIEATSGHAAMSINDGAPVIVPPELLAGYELDGRRLGELVRKELGCQYTLVDLPLGGMHDLGPLTIGTVQIRPVLVTRFVEDPVATERALQDLFSTQTRVVTIHLPHTDVTRWTRALSLDGLSAPFHVRPHLIRALRLENDVPAVELATDERLVVDLLNHTAWLDRVPLPLSEGELQTLRHLVVAWRSGRNVPSGELSKLLGDQAAIGDVARQRVSQLRKTIAGTLKAAGLVAPAVVQTVRRGEGYSLALKPYVRE